MKIAPINMCPHSTEEELSLEPTTRTWMHQVIIYRSSSQMHSWDLITINTK